jgi:glycine dehydrogenase subunit 1
MFTPHTEKEVNAMLRTIGVQHLQDLFTDVPEKFRFPHLDLPPAMTEMEIMTELTELAAANETTDDLVCFLGAGAYNHYIPAAVDSILRRSEFYTSYTPYQPEISQGTLQAIFEYQSLMVALTGMEVCNASHYDGATATAEAVVMAYHHFRGSRKSIVLSPTLNPQYRSTILCYARGITGLTVMEGATTSTQFGNPDVLLPLVNADTALVIVQYPDFLGQVFDLANFTKAVHSTGALVAVVANPIALGFLKSPGEYGADIVTCEGQPLGIPLNYGGPYLGIFTAKKELVRKMSGRIVGETVDQSGKRAYVLTLTAREQHIRREKATSNICTNQGLMALASTVYLALLGSRGLRQVAELCYHKAHYLAREICAIEGINLAYDTPFFNEFTISLPKVTSEINRKLLDYGILGGYDLGNKSTELGNYLLVAVTEKNTKEQMDVYCRVLREVISD